MQTSSMFNPSVAAVVVAFSRLELLQRLIEGLRTQSRCPDEIIVVYQGSEPQIEAWLSEQRDLTLLCQDNRGSAGGFATGIEASMQRGHGWTWIFDDDAVPEADALEQLLACPHYGKPETTFLASRVIDAQGVTYMSPVPCDANRWYGTVLQDRCVQVTSACWLGVLVSSRAVQRWGLPIEEFFIGEEDLEFTGRLARRGSAYCVIPSAIRHFQSSSFDAHGKDFLKHAYQARNSVARLKIEPGSPLSRAARSLHHALRLLGRVARGESPVRTVPWILEGLLVFRPRVRYPNAHPGS
jgi:rhamnopyranosyl-N-acetylglucosaminyl-diphospho-decaprenol beta-1,3/1,4-galactofuranosyltransferase